MYKLSKKYKFCAAHKLKDTKSLVSKMCREVHGHNWGVQVEIKTDELVDDMIVDFAIIKKIINKLDHQDLNKILDFNPTAENLSKYFHDEFVKYFKSVKQFEFIPLIKVTVEETSGSKVSYYDNKDEFENL